MDASKKRKSTENGLENTVNLTLEDARNLLEPLTHNQLLTLHTTAITTYPSLLTAARSLADTDTSRRKLFVRGLGPETTTESLKSLFSTYGELEEAVVIGDKNSGKSKGYGFVTFRHVDEALVALRQPSKRIDGRMTVTHLASAGRGLNGEDQSTRKIYIGNVPYDVSAERLLDYFSVFGEIEEGPLGFDKQGGKTRGFAFFVYKTEQGARASLIEANKIIDGHQVMCKLAEDGKKGKIGISMGNPGQNPVPNPGPIGEPMSDRMGPNSMNSGYAPSYGPVSGGYGPGPNMGGPYNSGPYNSGEYTSYRMPPPSNNPPLHGHDGGYPGFSSSGYMGPSNNPPPHGPPQGPPGPMYQRMPPYY